MKRYQMKDRLLSFLREEDGQSTTEYILILAIVVMIALKFKDTLGGLMGRTTEELEGKIMGAINSDL